jgi:lysophospholipid acyltransferase (LPLAT)-like uncharacterized protein
VSEQTTSPNAGKSASVNLHYDTRQPRLTPWRRAQIPVIAAVASTLLRAICPTLRFESLGSHHLDELHARGERAIGAFWHRCIFSAIWCWRGRGVVVMNTANFDGKWTRRVIEGLGYGTAQGSSSRGGLRGLAVMAQRIEQGHDVAFTIDGPRGPRYIAKPGPVMLARRTGQPIVLFHTGIEHGRTLEKAWDHFRIPYPFSRAVMVMAPPIHVPRDADARVVEMKQAEMQAALERIRDIGESWFTLDEDERKRLRREFGE